jgi:hypothetical protein
MQSESKYKDYTVKEKEEIVEFITKFLEKDGKILFTVEGELVELPPVDNWLCSDLFSRVITLKRVSEKYRTWE